uniref:Uncharacterized protein n=1 Tax=Physcomitrium patens TaxID=3218 RepID=A0A2K1JW35_PHYPA|nr:hypothetical protein PHYPA_015502 [Physcomitrium patens]
MPSFCGVFSAFAVSVCSYTRYSNFLMYDRLIQGSLGEAYFDSEVLGKVNGATFCSLLRRFVQPDC